MNISDAITILHPDTTREEIRRIVDSGKDAIKEVEEACMFACDIMKKHIERKPIEDRHHEIRYTEIYRCPSCNGTFSGRGLVKYCYHCGQKIDWRGITDD